MSVGGATDAGDCARSDQQPISRCGSEIVRGPVGWEVVGCHLALAACVGGPGTPVPTGRAQAERAHREAGWLGCHSRSAGQIGPELRGLDRAEFQREDGSPLNSGGAAIRESITSPSPEVVSGPCPVMPARADLLSEPELGGLVDSIVALGS